MTIDTLAPFAYAFVVFAVAVAGFAVYAIATAFRPESANTPVVTVTRTTEVELTRAA